MQAVCVRCQQPSLEPLVTRAVDGCLVQHCRACYLWAEIGDLLLALPPADATRGTVSDSLEVVWSILRQRAAEQESVPNGFRHGRTAGQRRQGQWR